MNIEKFDLPPGTEIEVCSGEHFHTKPGYRLVAIVTAQRPIRRDEPVIDPGSYPRTKTVWETGTTVDYVMARDLQTALEVERQRIIVLQGHVWEAEKNAKESKDALLVAEATVKQLEAETKTLNSNLISSSRNYDAACTSSRKLEVDIGKLREALGDIRMKEILGDR